MSCFYSHDFCNFVMQSTCVATRISKIGDKSVSKSLIDVVLHNGNLIESDDVVDTTLSDHSIKIPKLSTLQNSA